MDDEPDVWAFGDQDTDASADASADAGHDAGDDDGGSIWGDDPRPTTDAAEAAAAVVAALDARDRGTVPPDDQADDDQPDDEPDDEPDEEEVFTFSIDTSETPHEPASPAAMPDDEIPQMEVLNTLLAEAEQAEAEQAAQNPEEWEDASAPEPLADDHTWDIVTNTDVEGSMADRAVPITTMPEELPDEEVWVFSVNTGPDEDEPLATSARPSRDTGWADADADEEPGWPNLPAPIPAAADEDDAEPEVVTLSTGLELADALSAAAAAAAALDALPGSSQDVMGFAEHLDDDDLDDDDLDDVTAQTAQDHAIRPDIPAEDEPLEVDDWFDDDLEMSAPTAAPPAAPAPADEQDGAAAGQPPPPALATMDLQNFSSGGRKRRRRG